MRAASFRATLTAAVTISLLAAPALAPAKPGHFVFPGYRARQLTVEGTHGVSIAVTRVGHRVELSASQGDRAAIYIVHPQRSSRDGIRATFPGLGRIAVRFHPSGQARHSPRFPGCRSGGEVTQHGTFTGAIRFRGEHGFTRVAVGRAHGSVLHSFKEVCAQSDGNGDSKHVPAYSLTAYDKSGGRAVLFTAWQSTVPEDTPSDALYFVSSLERRLGMRVVRVALARGDLDTFVIAGPDSASVAPSAPFSGTAAFSGTPNGQSEWTGTLTVDLPGAEGVALAGPSFSSSLCRGQSCTGRPIDESAKRARLFAQGSGSHSHAFWDARLSWSR
jgi:hypothetical protein